MQAFRKRINDCPCYVKITYSNIPTIAQWLPYIVDLYWKVISHDLMVIFHCLDLILLSRSFIFDISRAYLETFFNSYPYGWFHGICHLQFFAFQIEASASPLPQSLACHLLIPRLITALLWFLKLKIEEVTKIS